MFWLKRDTVAGPIYVWRGRTNHQSKFRIPGLRPGRYIRKSTLQVFRSIFRPVRIAPRCSPKKELLLKLELEV